MKCRSDSRSSSDSSSNFGMPCHRWHCLRKRRPAFPTPTHLQGKELCRRSPRAGMQRKRRRSGGSRVQAHLAEHAGNQGSCPDSYLHPRDAAIAVALRDAAASWRRLIGIPSRSGSAHQKRLAIPRMSYPEDNLPEIIRGEANGTLNGSARFSDVHSLHSHAHPELSHEYGACPRYERRMRHRDLRLPVAHAPRIDAALEGSLTWCANPASAANS